METFLQRYAAKSSSSQDGSAGMMQFHNATGSLEFLGIDKIVPAGAESSVGLYTRSMMTDRQKWTHIEFRVKQNASSKTAVGELDVTDAVPAQIVNLNFKGLQAPGSLIALHF